MFPFFLKIYLFFNFFNFSFQYYDMKFGHLFMNYYNNKDCIGSPNKTVSYSIEDNKVLYLLNSQSIVVSRNYSFDFFSTTIYYSSTEDEEDSEDDDTRRGLLCNGLCYKRQEGTDILVDSSTELSPDYEEESEKSQYFSCVYNNIIKNATIKLEKFSDKNCKTKLESGEFHGTQMCWNINSYSYRPLYFEDDGKRIYYHLYNSKDCTSDHYEYFDFNGYYFECDDSCYQDKNNQNHYYKCQFNNSRNKYILNRIHLIIFIIIFFL